MHVLLIVEWPYSRSIVMKLQGPKVSCAHVHYHHGTGLLSVRKFISGKSFEVNVREFK